MSLLQIGLDISRGIGQANHYQFLRQGNYDANQGMNYVFSTITSVTLIGDILSKINIVIENIKFAEISPIPRSIILSTSIAIPCTLNYIKKSINFISHPNLHTIIKLLDYQIFPNVILVANLASAVGLIALGNPIYGGCNFAFLIINLLDEQGWINADFIKKNPILITTLLICRASYLLTSLNLTNAISLLDMLFNIIYKLTGYKNNIPNVIHPITLKEFENLNNPVLTNFDLNNYHLLKEPISNNPIPDLENQFDEYASSLENYLKTDLSIHRPMLLGIFQDDEKWQNDYNNNPIDYLKDGTNSLISYMRKLTNQKDLKNKFLSLVRHMSKLPDHDCIFLLARLSQTGHYCPQRRLMDINQLYDTFIDTIEKRSLSNKLIEILHQDRSQILDQILANINQIKPFINALDNLDRENLCSDEIRQFIQNQLRQWGFTEENFEIETRRLITNLDTILKRCLTLLIPPFEDVHFANIIKNTLSPHLHVHHKNIDVLTADTRSVLEKWSIDFMLKSYIIMAKQKFSDQYNLNIVFKRIRDIINNESTITFPEIEDWFKEQYLKSNPQSTSEEAIVWFQENVYDDDGLIKSKYLLFLLVNQGIFELQENAQYTSPTCIRQAV